MATRIKTDSKLFWSHVRDKTKTKSTVGALKKEDGSFTSNDHETASILNQYFASVFENESLDNLPQFGDRNYSQPLLDVEITTEKVVKAINVLKLSKSQGPDMIHPRLLEETCSCISLRLKHLFRKSLDKGILPED